MDKSRKPRRGVPDNSNCLSPQALRNVHAGQGTSSEKQHVTECPFCSDALEGYALASDSGQFSAAMSDLQQRVDRQLPVQRIPSWKAVAVAAAIALLLSIPVFNWLSGPSANDLFAENFQPYPNAVTIVRDTTGLSALQEAMIRYEENNYSEALVQLKALLAENPSQEEVRFYAGICYLEAGQAENALGTLAPLLLLPEGKWFRPAQWYSALAHLKSGQTEKATVLLKKLVGSEEFGDRANDILEAQL